MSQAKTDMELVGQTAEAYFQGLHHCDAAKLEAIFHPDAHIGGWREGVFVNRTRTEFIDFVKSAPAPSQNGEAYDMKVVGVDLTGTTGLLKVQVLFLGFRFTDYLSLLKIDDAWVIMNKVFWHEPKG
jgi:putative lumazine-binding protein